MNMHVVLIGGTGHVGTYLVPRLVEAGHRVTVMSRGRRKPYQDHPAWSKVENELMDRETEERTATFAGKVAELAPDVVIDMICFTPESARHLVEGIRGKVRQLLFCGTIWVHGPSVTVPTHEHENIRPFGEYGIQKARMREFLVDEARRTGLPVTLLHPGHIVGPGWTPVNPLGNFNPSVFTRIARGERLSFPTQGLETVHHVHADDVAQIFQRSLENWAQAAGEEFHVVSEQAITLRGYAEAVAAWFGREANLAFSATDEWKQGLSEEDVAFTWDHLLHSPNCSIEKAKRCLGFAPRYTSLQAVWEALAWLVEQGLVTV
jgi:nucleoside-diphosphate-sugar epimerase